MRRRALLFLALLAPVARLRARPRPPHPMRPERGIDVRGGWILKKGER